MRAWLGLAFTLALICPATAALAAGDTHANVARSEAAPKPLAADELADVSAGQAATVALTNQALSALNVGNSINANVVRSGDISFSAQALSNFAGIGNFVVNTGANNNLQGSLSVTVVAAPAVGR